MSTRNLLNMRKLTPLLLLVAFVKLGSAVDPTRVIDLEALRKMAVDSYLSGQDYEALYREDIDPGKLQLLLSVGVLVVGFVLALIASSCAAVLMRDFYNDYAIHGLAEAEPVPYID